MNQEKVGKFRLLRQVHGRGAFAEVRVVIRPAKDDANERVHWAIDQPSQSIQPEIDQLEASAALNGALHGLELAESLGAQVKDEVVWVVHVGINVADTEPDAVRAAASAAVVQAFGLEDKCRLFYDNGWKYDLKPSPSGSS